MGKIDKLILSAYYKNKGCKVKLISFEEINPSNLFTEKYDVIFVSKVSKTQAFVVERL